jgi:uncharacterized membrane protein
MIDSVLLLCTLIGLSISTYFTAIAYRWIQPDSEWIPNFCRMGEKTCASIVFTPRARVLGLPNSVLGQFFYMALLVGIPIGILEALAYYWLYLAASLLTVLLGLYLSYSLLFITKVRCKLCLTSHGLNVIIFLILLVR